MTGIQLEDHEATQEEVLRWRLEQLKLAGYTARDARLIARRFDIDLHEATDLVRNGCPPPLAFRILR
jgi:hypothetical protein